MDLNLTLKLIIVEMWPWFNHTNMKTACDPRRAKVIVKAYAYNNPTDYNKRHKIFIKCVLLSYNKNSPIKCRRRGK